MTDETEKPGDARAIALEELIQERMGTGFLSRESFEVIKAFLLDRPTLSTPASAKPEAVTAQEAGLEDIKIEAGNYMAENNRIGTICNAEFVREYACDLIEHLFPFFLATMPKQIISNTEILMFIMGFQGGTVHQVSEHLGLTVSEIINADYDTMQNFMRGAQAWKRITE